ncbi:MAG TPA: helix-turn-helix transcriptional regulator [Thermoanaerobaculia bacterium]|jgi:transcriptional regulator with XRE-family HTH domain|nr:helix-turn-helix transcriptional regulator [Thermoanaerobaculia bacterium]
MPHLVDWLTNAALRLVREALGWDQKELAAMAGVSPATISDYELGRLAEPLERERLDELAALMGAPKAAVEIALGALEAIRSIADAGALDDELKLPRELREVLELAAAKIWRMRRQNFDSAGSDLLLEAARSQAAVVWEALRRLSHDDRRFLLDHTPGYVSWATVERLAHESERAAARNVNDALELGALAVWAADHVPGPPALQAAAKEYAWCYWGNARRVKGSHAEAASAFARAKREGQGVGELAMSPFSRARMLDREASLRRDQRQFGEALKLSDQALLIAHPSEVGMLWLNRSAVLEQSGDAEGALSALREAHANLDETTEPRHRVVAMFNLAASLLDLGRAEEAATLLPGLRILAEVQRDTIDLVRLNWLEGRTALAFGETQVATAALEQVWLEFTAQELNYDAGLSALNLAECYLTAGRHAETRALARKAAKVFRDLEIEKEELAAVRLFLAAAELERATAEQARLAYRALAAYRAQRGYALAAPDLEAGQ